MNEREKPAMSDSERKAKIRERYKGISRDELEVIPAIMPASFHEDTSDKRVAVYARVRPFVMPDDISAIDARP